MSRALILGVIVTVAVPIRAGTAVEPGIGTLGAGLRLAGVSLVRDAVAVVVELGAAVLIQEAVLVFSLLGATV